MILYQEYPPHPALNAYVACLWTCDVHAKHSPHSHRVLPDNCIDILWQEHEGESFAVGMMTGAIHVESTGVVRTVAVRFKPGAAAYFFDLPLHELCNQRIDLDALWGREHTRRIGDELWARQLSAPERLAILVRHLFARLLHATDLSAREPTAGVLVRSAIAAIERATGVVRIESLAQSMNISRQHLAAQFRSRVGISPKMFARICRFQNAARAIKTLQQNQIDWSQLALEHGYFDQAHLIHEFQQFANNTPHFLAQRRN